MSLHHQCSLENHIPMSPDLNSTSSVTSRQRTKISRPLYYHNISFLHYWHCFYQWWMNVYTFRWLHNFHQWQMWCSLTPQSPTEESTEHNPIRSLLMGGKVVGTRTASWRRKIRSIPNETLNRNLRRMWRRLDNIFLFFLFRRFLSVTHCTNILHNFCLIVTESKWMVPSAGYTFCEHVNISD